MPISRPSLSASGHRLFRARLFLRPALIRAGLALLLALVMLPPLAGCTGKGPKPITLTYMQWGDPQEVGITEKLLAAFEKTHPGINVNIIHATDYQTKLNIMMAGGTPPDVFYVDASDFARHVDNGSLLDLTPFIQADPDLKLADFYPHLLAAFTSNGRLMGIPKGFTTLVMYYNQNFFDEEHLKYPDSSWDWKTFLENCQKLTKPKGSRGIHQYGVLAGMGFEAFIYQNRGRILSSDGRQCLLDRPEAMEAIQFLADLRNQYHVCPTTLEAQDSPVGLNVGGSAMEFSGRWMVPRLREITKFTWDVAPLPKGKVRASLLFTVCYSISKDSKHPREAWQLVRFLTGSEGQTMMSQLGLEVPSRRSVAESPAFKSDLPPRHSDVYLSALDYAVLLPYNRRWNEIRDQMNSSLDLVWTGDRTVAEGCREATQKINLILEQIAAEDAAKARKSP